MHCRGDLSSQQSSEEKNLALQRTSERNVAIRTIVQNMSLKGNVGNGTNTINTNSSLAVNQHVICYVLLYTQQLVIAFYFKCNQNPYLLFVYKIAYVYGNMERKVAKENLTVNSNSSRRDRSIMYKALCGESLRVHYCVKCIKRIHCPQTETKNVVKRDIFGYLYLLNHSSHTIAHLRHHCIDIDDMASALHLFTKQCVEDLNFGKIPFKRIVDSFCNNRLFSNDEQSYLKCTFCMNNISYKETEHVERINHVEIYQTDPIFFLPHYFSFEYFVVKLECTDLRFLCLSFVYLITLSDPLDVRIDVDVNAIYKPNNNVAFCSNDFQTDRNRRNLECTDRKKELVENDLKRIACIKEKSKYHESPKETLRQLQNPQVEEQQSQSVPKQTVGRQECKDISLNQTSKCKRRCTVVHFNAVPIADNTHSQSETSKEDDFRLKTKETEDSDDDLKAVLRHNTQQANSANFSRTQYTVAPVFGKCDKDNSKRTDSPKNKESEQERAGAQDSAASRARPDDNEHIGAHGTQVCAPDSSVPVSSVQDEVRVDGHGSMCEGLHQYASNIPKVDDFLEAEPSTDSSGREENAHDSARGNALPLPCVDNAELRRFEPLMHIIDKIADGERVPPQITMRYEMLRFCTLRSFPKENKPYITRIAQAGLYYANSGDELVCYCCGRRKSNWRESDNPMDIHRQLNPNCRFLIQNSEVNVPIRESALASERSIVQTHCASSLSDTSQNPQPEPNNETQSGSNVGSHRAERLTENIGQTSFRYSPPSQQASQERATASSSGQITFSNKSGIRGQTRAHGNFVQVDDTRSMRKEIHQQSLTVTSKAVDFSSDIPSVPPHNRTGNGESTMPKYPKYASISVRLTSFSDCSEIVVRPDGLAEAGLFFAGFGDCVRCFQCGVGLRHWSEEDDPWIEHSRWSKDCLFVKQMRGQEFVNLVQMAVQYSENQNQEQQNRNEVVASSNQRENGVDETEKLLHTDAAQSVLEMDIDPNTIRRAIRAILSENERPNLTAAKLLEKIFEMEEAETSASLLQNGEQEVQNQQTSSSNIEPTVTFATTAVGEEGHTGTRTTRGDQLQNRNEENGGILQASAGTVGSIASADISGTGCTGGTGSTRNNRRSQILEQKRLKDENEMLKKQSICTKCKTRDVCIVFLPCGHLVTCEECAPTVKYCTVQSCGKYIKGTVRTYLA